MKASALGDSFGVFLVQKWLESLCSSQNMVRIQVMLLLFSSEVILCRYLPNQLQLENAFPSYAAG